MLLFSFASHRKRKDIFYSGLKFSLIMTSHSVKCKFKLLFFTLDSGKISLQLKYILNLASVTFFLKCSIKKFYACLALRSFFAQIYRVYIFVRLTGISPAWNFSSQNLVLL